MIELRLQGSTDLCYRICIAGVGLLIDIQSHHIYSKKAFHCDADCIYQDLAFATQ